MEPSAPRADSQTSTKQPMAERRNWCKPALRPVLDAWLYTLEDDAASLPPSDADPVEALMGPTLRSLDALHLVGAIRLNVEALVTYDSRLAVAAAHLGLRVLAPEAI